MSSLTWGVDKSSPHADKNKEGTCNVSILIAGLSVVLIRNSIFLGVVHLGSPSG